MGEPGIGGEEVKSLVCSVICWEIKVGPVVMIEQFTKFPNIISSKKSISNLTYDGLRRTINLVSSVVTFAKIDSMLKFLRTM